MKIIYTYSHEFNSWVFTTPERLNWYQDIHEAFESKTWGEFQTKMPPDDFDWISPILIEKQFGDEDFFEEDFIPSPDSPFDHNEFIWDAEYPGYLIYEHEDVLPKEIINQHGIEIVTMHDGVYFQFPEHTIGGIVSMLRDLGFQLEHRPDLDFS